jgi:hypothetical protein
MNLYADGAQNLGEEDDAPRMMTVEEYQEYRTSCEEVIRQADAAIKLANNPEFKELVMDGYFTREPQRLGQLMASGRMNEKQFEQCSLDLKGIAGFRSYLMSFTQKGQIARNELRDLEEAYQAAVDAQMGNSEMEG